MSQGDRGTLGLIKIATPNVTIGGIRNWGLTSGMNVLAEAAGGAVDPTFVTILDHRPVIKFSTRDLTVLSSAGIGGAALTDLDAYIQKLTRNSPTRVAAGSAKFSMAAGVMAPRTLSARQGQPAELAMEAIGLSANGTTACVAVTTAQTMPAHPTTVEWTAGPVSINGTSYDVESASVDFGLNVLVEASGGAVYPTYATIMDRKPKVTLEVKDFDGAGLGIDGLAQAATDSIVYFRKLAHGGTRVADETAEHCKITINDGLIRLEQAGATHGQRATSTVIIEPTFATPTAILVVSFAAIT